MVVHSFSSQIAFGQRTTKNGQRLKHKVNFINPSHQQTRVKEEIDYAYNHEEAQKIFWRKNIRFYVAFPTFYEGIVGDAQVIE